MGLDPQLFEQLKKLRVSKTLIVGIGNTLKGDDGAGPSVCEQLRRAGVAAELIDAGTAPENYIEPIVKKAPQNLLIIDAVAFGDSPGAISVFRPEQLSSLAFSTHTLSPRLFIEMIAGQIQADVFFLGIQPAQTQLGQALSGPVREAVQLLARTLAEIFTTRK